LYFAHSAVNGHIQLHDGGCGYCDNVTLVSDREDDDPDLAWDAWQDGSKRRNEDGDSCERSDNQKGERDKDNRRRHVFCRFSVHKTKLYLHDRA